MRMMTMTLAVVLAVGCGKQTETSGGSSKLHFITFGPEISGLVGKVKKKTMTACLSGHTSSDRATWEKNIQSTILKWIEPLRQLTAEQLTSEIKVIDGRGKCDTDVVIAQGTHSNTSIGSYPIVRMSPEGYFAGYNVLLHEFGHAFALSDTYQSGQSGNCKPGQPQAVMCNTSFKELQTDDSAGVKAIFKRTFPKDTLSDEGDITAGLTITVSIALGKKIAEDTYEVFAGISGVDSKKADAVYYCVGNCDQIASWTQMQKALDRNDSVIYTAGAQGLLDGSIFQIRVKAGHRQKKNKFELKAI